MCADDAVIRNAGLAALEARVRHDLEIMDYPKSSWVKATTDPSGQHVADVTIIGGGQAGLAIAFALRREKVDNVAILDRNAEGQEGPWLTYARMRDLRTPKYLTGPDLGIPSLTFRAWYEAQGLDWDALVRIPRPMWMDYLTWYRRVLALQVENGANVVSVGPAERGLIALEVEHAGRRETRLTRKAIFANGMEGGGGWTVPDEFAKALPRHLYAHSSDDIDFAALRGKRIGVLGIGAGAADNAAVALESGAARVDLFCRRTELPRVEARAWIEHNGFLRHFYELDDSRRWWIMRRFWETGAPAPPWSLDLAASYPGFHLHVGAPWQALAHDGDTIVATTPQGEHRFEFVIFATGLVVDLRRQPEFASIAEQIATWADRYTPPPGEESPSLALCPYLGRGYQLMEKAPGTAPCLADIHLFNWAATPSNGISASSITGMKFGVPRLVWGVTRDLYLALADDHARLFPWKESRQE